MSTHAVELPAERAHGVLVRQLRWLAAGFLLAFFVPFVFADTLDVPRDLYYAIYAVAVGGFFVAWARSTDQSLGEMVRRRWVLAVVLGLVVAAVMVLIVLRTEDATARPGGATLAGEIIWRGLVYGAMDGLLLSAFPILAVFAAFAGRAVRDRPTGKIAVGAAALAASVLMTT